MDAANCAAVLLSLPISYHFHGCTALLVALVSGTILNTHLYLFTFLSSPVMKCMKKVLLVSTIAVLPGSCLYVSGKGEENIDDLSLSF